MKILLIDNFDSFTYNLVALLKIIGCEVLVIRNQDIGDYKLLIKQVDKIIISPGPSHPANSKLTLDAIDYANQFEIPLLGICLGHQAIGFYFGAKITKAIAPIHGKVSQIHCYQNILWKNIPENFEVARYHSLIVHHQNLPSNLEILADTNDKHQIIMALKVVNKPIYGLQFHPESIASQFGEQMINNFIWT